MSTHVYKTMAEAVDGLRQRGFTTDFAAGKESGQITAGDWTFNSDDLTIVEHHRFEECPIRTIPRWSTRSKRRMDSREFS